MPIDYQDFKEKFYPKIKKDIESVHGKGGIEMWTERDFKTLSLDITDQTGEVLSVTTLKRILGKVENNATPQLHTLNILANYISKKDWNTYKENIFKAQSKPQISLSDINSKKSKSTKASDKLFGPKIIIGTLSLLSIILGLLLYIQIRSKSEKNEPKAESFNSAENYMHIMEESMTLPKKFTFSYIFKSLDPENSINLIRFEPPNFIYMAHDNKGRGTMTYSYEKPGIYNVKALSNKTVLCDTNLLVSSDGWWVRKFKDEESILKNDYETLIYKKKNNPFEHQVKLNPETNKIAGQIDIYMFSIFEKFHANGDNFIIQLKMKSRDYLKSRTKNNVKIQIYGTTGKHILEFTNKNKPNLTYGEFGDKTFYQDLSYQNKMKFDLDHMNTYTWAVVNKKVEFFDSVDKKYFRTEYSENIGKMVGIELTTNGFPEIEKIQVFDTLMKPVTVNLVQKNISILNKKSQP